MPVVDGWTVSYGLIGHDQWSSASLAARQAVGDERYEQARASASDLTPQQLVDILVGALENMP